jgi:hypothetical protein
MRQFADKYGSMANELLTRHFSRPIFEDYYNKIFGEVQYLGYIDTNNKINSGNYRDSAVSSDHMNQR